MKSRLVRHGRAPQGARTVLLLLIAAVVFALNSASGASVPAELTWTAISDDDAVEILAPGGIKTRISHSDADPERGLPATTRIEEGAAVRTLEYDTEGRLTAARGGAADVGFAYNGLGLSSEVQSSGTALRIRRPGPAQRPVHRRDAR